MNYKEFVQRAVIARIACDRDLLESDFDIAIGAADVLVERGLLDPPVDIEELKRQIIEAGERKWFESSFVKFKGCGPIGYCFKNYARDIIGGYYLIHNIPVPPSFTACRQDYEKIGDAYEHWVASGRP